MSERYPVVSRPSVIDCPIHDCSVAVAEDGRIASQCPLCRAEARVGVNRLRQRRKRDAGGYKR